MQIFLILLLVAAMVATVVALVRGIIIFLKTTREELESGEAGPSASAVRSNKMMQARILFQALAVMIVVLLLFAAQQG